MTTVKAREPSIVRTAVALLAAVYAATFVVAVLLHVGVEIAVATPLGLLPSEVENPMGLLGEPLEHLAPSAPGPAAGMLPCGAAYGTLAPSSATSLSPSSSGSIPSASSSDPAAPR